MRVIIKKSTKSEKKMMAIFYEGDKKVKTTHFGSAGMEDFTKTRDIQQKQRYLARHKKNENWGKYMTAGSLSRYILWNLPTKQASILNYKKRFNLQ
tara:strand:+ start:3136 stop:3423 length:288 start_codon:yes stop_codon:yes gene_type:complete